MFIRNKKSLYLYHLSLPDPDQGQRDGVCERHHVLQGEGALYCTILCTVLYYKVANATHAVANVDDYSGSARLLAATTLRNVLGTLTLGEILSQRESIAKEMRVIKYSI